MEKNNDGISNWCLGYVYRPFVVGTARTMDAGRVSRSLISVTRGELGRFAPSLPALERFKRKCRFEPETGCVLWTGATTSGRGHTAPYGGFWYEGRRWFAHRWAAKFIHGLDIDGFHVDHCCPNIPKPNTLCVEHLQARTPMENVALQHERRKFFIHLQIGLIDPNEVYGPDIGHDMTLPYFIEPEWLKHVV